jgi:hypothetical protein
MQPMNRRSLLSSADALSGTDLLTHKPAGAHQEHSHTDSPGPGLMHHPSLRIRSCFGCSNSSDLTP